jgi:hypothetical protein
LPQAYRPDNGDATVDLTMAYAGFRKNLEHSGLTRILMRLDLR